MEEQKKVYHKENKLRFALMCNDNVLQAWQVKCLDELMSLDFVEPVLIISQKSIATKKSFFQKVKNYPWPNLLFRAYKRIHKMPLQKTEKLPAYFSPVKTIECLVIKKGKYSEYFSPGDIQQIKNVNPDFIIRFGFNILKGEILDAARYGVWSYHHGDERKFRGGPPAFWEVHKNEFTCGAILQRLTDKLDAGIVLKHGNFAVTNHSYNTTLATVYALSSSWIKQVCIDLQNNVARYFEQAPSQTNAKIYTYPKNATMVVFRLKKFGRKCAFHWNDLFQAETWKVGILSTDNKENANRKIKWYTHPQRNGYYADPFPAEVNGKQFLLVEDYHYKTTKGKITSIDAETGNTQVLIEEDFHLSYPFTFSFENKTWVLPESAAAGKIHLYEVDLAANTILRKHLLLDNINAYDPSLFHYNHKWWLFVTEKQTDSNTCLHIYHCETLTGTYKAHANNPVKCDIANARPAGNIMRSAEWILRPAQNCSRTYGGSVVLNKLVVLNEYEFIEQKHDEIFPEPVYGYAKGLHTLNGQHGALVLDVKKGRFNFPNFRCKLAKKLRLSR